MTSRGNKRPNSNSEVPEDKRFRETETQNFQVEEETFVNVNKNKKETMQSSHNTATLETILDKIQVLECLPGIQDAVQKLTDEFKDLKASIQFTQGEVDEIKGKLQKQEKEVASMKEEIREVYNLKEENKSLRNQILALETYNRRENLVIENIPELADENCAHVVQTFFSKELKIAHTIQLQRVHRLGKKSNQNETNPNRPIIVRFLRYPDREEVWQARSKLKGTSIILREDFPEKIESERRMLLPIFRAARQIPNMTTKLVANKLVINQQTYTVETLELLPSCVSPRAVSERIVEADMGRKYHLFEGKLSPFSNMFPSHFEIGGKHFLCVEQYYTYKKALFAKNEDIADKILREKDPVKMKRYGKAAKVNHKVWLSDGAKPAMEEALMAKFQQNPELRKILMNTKGYCLAECSRYDTVWGTGVGLNSQEAENSTTWKGHNLLGTLLNQTRDNLC